ncbi:GNAT family N-acetyltransferase [Macrococcus brunensis]|uniref:GNAT family N-acetyltransferase n=1 Tax=Macrococcus brunensis TaxID=198483 RepID=UPI001EF0082D|nr:GNAT family N-acetyltransferase [Macrococcus brunensis]ULG72478.1 GNAT family N-acetyltransferase [Macrococcus brunensis]
MIRIMKVSPGMEIPLERYTLSLSQMRFSGHPKYIINRKKADYQPFVILKDNEVIGVFALETGSILKTMGAGSDAIYLRGLSISSSHQGKGYFRQALKAIEKYCASLNKSELYLMVNVKNDNGYYAFIKTGFIDRKRIVRQGLLNLKVLSKTIQNH